MEQKNNNIEKCYGLPNSCGLPYYYKYCRANKCIEELYGLVDTGLVDFYVGKYVNTHGRLPIVHLLAPIKEALDELYNLASKLCESIGQIELDDNHEWVEDDSLASDKNIAWLFGSPIERSVIYTADISNALKDSELKSTLKTICASRDYVYECGFIKTNLNRSILQHLDDVDAEWEWKVGYVDYRGDDRIRLILFASRKDKNNIETTEKCYIEKLYDLVDRMAVGKYVGKYVNPYGRLPIEGLLAPAKKALDKLYNLASRLCESIGQIELDDKHEWVEDNSFVGKQGLSIMLRQAERRVYYTAVITNTRLKSALKTFDSRVVFLNERAFIRTILDRNLLQHLNDEDAELRWKVTYMDYRIDECSVKLTLLAYRKDKDNAID